MGALRFARKKHIQMKRTKNVCWEIKILGEIKEMKNWNLKKMMMFSGIMVICLMGLVNFSFARTESNFALMKTFNIAQSNKSASVKKNMLVCWAKPSGGAECHILYDTLLDCKEARQMMEPYDIVCKEYEYLTSNPTNNPTGKPTRLLVEKGKVYIEVDTEKHLLSSDKSNNFLEENLRLLRAKRISQEEFKKRINDFQKTDDGIVSEQRLNFLSRTLNAPIVRDSDTKNPVDETFIGLFMPNQNQVLDGKITQSIPELKEKGKPITLSGYDKELNGKEKMYLFAPTSVKILTDNKSLSNDKHLVEISYEIMKAKDGSLFAVPFPIISMLEAGKKNEDCNVRCGGGKGKCGVDFCWELLPSDSTTKPYSDDLLRTNVPNAVNHRFVNGKNRFAYQAKVGGFNYLIIIETNIPREPVALIDDGRKWCCCFVRKANQMYCQRVIKNANCANLCAKVNKVADSQQ